MNWYSKVSKDIGHLPTCLDYFYSELDQARAEVKIYGNVEKASASLPGIVEHRFNQLQEVEAVLEYLNIELRRIRSKAFKKYLENYLLSENVQSFIHLEKKMKTITKSVQELISTDESPLPLSVIPNYMGINLCSVDSITWTKQPDGQLVNLTINFVPAGKDE